MAKVFISYRRDDSRWVSGRIYDALVARYGPENVFKDVYTIPLGIDFRKFIGDQVSQCDVMLVIIGQHWLTITDETGNRRLDNGADFTRIEIEQALQRSIPVIPVLVDGIGMPRPEELPASLEQLAFRNAATVRDPEFPSDMERIARDISKTLAEAAPHAAPSENAPAGAETAKPPAIAQPPTPSQVATASTSKVSGPTKTQWFAILAYFGGMALICFLGLVLRWYMFLVVSVPALTIGFMLYGARENWRS